MNARLLTLLAACALPLAAQSPTPGASPEPGGPPTARQRLTDALQKTAATPDTAFAAKWGPEKVDRNNPFARLIGSMATGAVKGSWHDDLRCVAFDGDEGDELLIRAGRMIAKDGKRDWRRRRGHFADGNVIEHVPDPRALLQQLADWQLAVTNRSAGALDDRPVELISVTLNAEQVGELLWAGLLPQALTSNTLFANVAVQFGGNNNGRAAAQLPKATLDLAIALDPGTGLVHQLRARSWSDTNVNGGVFVFPAGNQAAGEDEEEEEEEDEIDDDGPLVYERGLPKRSRKDKSVVDFTLTFTHHGEQPKPALNETQQQLLR